MKVEIQNNSFGDEWHTIHVGEFVQITSITNSFDKEEATIWLWVKGILIPHQLFKTDWFRVKKVDEESDD